MIMKKYQVSVKTHSLEDEKKQNDFVKKFVNFLNSCNYKRSPGSMEKVKIDDVKVETKVFTGSIVRALIIIDKPENANSILDKLYKLEEKLDAKLLAVDLVEEI